MDDMTTTHPESLTTPEAQTMSVVNILRFFCTIYQLEISLSSVGVGDKDRYNILRELKSWYSSMTSSVIFDGSLPGLVPFFLSGEPGVLNWEYFHGIFTVLDTFQLTIQALDYALVENLKILVFDQAHLEAVSNEVKEMMNQALARTHKAVSMLIYKLRVPGAAAKMVEHTIKKDASFIACDLEALIGMPGLEEIAANICSSWAEGLEGILRTKPF